MELKKENLEKLKISLSEPLFIVSIIAFFITILKFISNVQNDIFSYGVIGSLLILAAVSTYFSYLYFKKTNNYYLFGVPILIFLAFLFSYYGEYYTQSFGSWIKGDFTVFSAMVGIWILFYVLSLHKYLSKDTAGVIAIFFTMLLFHLLGATHPYLTSGDAFDSHWHYKIMNNTYTNEHVIDHDYLVYPAGESLTYLGDKNFVKQYDGLDFSQSPFLHAVFVASIAKILSPLNFNQYDIAMLFGGIMAGLTAILIFLFLSEIFHDFSPYNKLVGLIGAFGLTFSYGYASRAIAGSCEASEMGLMFLAGTLFLTFLAYRKRSLKFTIIAGISAFFFSLAWGGIFAYFMNGIGLFVVIYGMIKLLHKENCFAHVPYFVIPMIFPLFHGIILHAHNSPPIFNISTTTLVVLFGSIFIPLFFELIRNLLIKSGKIKSNEFEFGNGKIEIFNKYLQQKIYSIPKNALFGIVGGIFIIGIGIMIFTPVVQTVISALTVERHGVVYKTIAEQLGGSNDVLEFINPAGFINFIINRGASYGFLILYTFITIPILLYYSIIKKSYGAVIVLILGISGLWGFFNVPQLLFDSSLAVISLGATIGLIAGINKKDINGLRIIGTILVLLIPLTILPIVISGPSGNSLAYFSTLTHPGVILHAGEGDINIGSGILWWLPGLQWFKENTNKDDMILTWWDYGHWITSISERPVMIDNLQAIHWQLQDVARFFTYYETEEEAMKLIEKYPKIKYIVLDYTLIGKNHALHFIGNGNLTREGEKEYEEWLRNPENPNRKALGICQFGGKQKEYRSTGVGGETVNKLIFWCSYPPNKTQRTEYLASIIFYVGESANPNNPQEVQRYIKEIKVMGYTSKERYVQGLGNVPIPTEEMTLDEWKKNHNGSLLGIQSFGDVISCVMRDNPLGTICQFPMFREFVYAPDEFQNHMFTKLYLGEYADSYARVGLCDTEWCKDKTKRLKNWILVWDNSPYGMPLGYLRIWKLARACTDDSNCSSDQYCDNLHCIDKKKENEICNKSSECITGICENGKCRTKHLKEVGEECTSNDECKSNNCMNGKCVEISCLEKYNLSNDYVVFYHASWCPHCRKMEPLVKDLENQGYKFLWAGTDVPSESQNLKIAKECYKDVIKFDDGIPQFGCLANGKLHIGEFTSIDEMKKFADECRNATNK